MALCGCCVLLTMMAARAGDQPAPDLSASELADVLGVHWWTVQIPADIGPKDSVGVYTVTSDGKQTPASGEIGLGPTDKKLGTTARVFCWEDKASKQMKVALQFGGATGTAESKDYFALGASGGPGNGAVLKPGDILLKFDSSKSPSFTVGNSLFPGQTGLMVVVKRG